MWTVVDLLRSPAYAVPLVVNLTGSVWFFLLIGKAGEFVGASFCWDAERGVGGGRKGRGEERRGEELGERGKRGDQRDNDMIGGFIGGV